MTLTRDKAIAYLQRMPEHRSFSIFPSDPAVEVARKAAGRIIAAVCKEFGVTPAMILSPSRPWKVAEARHAVVYIMLWSGISTRRIAEILGRRCHGTVINSRKKASNLISIDPQYRARVERAKQSITLSTDRT